MARKPKVLANIPVELKSIIKTPITITPNTSILEARDIMLKYKISRLIVKAGKRAVGIITEKDIAKNISVFVGKPLAKMSVNDIMSMDLVTLILDSSIHECAKLMQEHKISSIIINNKENELVGLVTKTDLISTFLVQSTASLNISKIMTKNVITVSPNDSVFEIQSVLFNNKISRVIVKKNQCPVGVITYRDFVPAKTFEVYKEFINPSESAEISRNPQLNEFNVNRLSYLLTFSANDVMTKNPFVVYTDDVVYTAAILMIRHGISGIPVMRKKKLAGIITKTDIVKVLATKGKL